MLHHSITNFAPKNLETLTLNPPAARSIATKAAMKKYIPLLIGFALVTAVACITIHAEKLSVELKKSSAKARESELKAADLEAKMADMKELNANFESIIRSKLEAHYAKEQDLEQRLNAANALIEKQRARIAAEERAR